MSKYTTVVSRVLSLSLLSAVVVLLQTAFDAVEYAKLGAFGFGFAFIVVTGLAAGLLPLCAYSGIRRSKPKLLGCVAGSSYCIGLSDCLFVCFFTVVASVLYDVRDIVMECRTDPRTPNDMCPDDLANDLTHLCNVFHAGRATEAGVERAQAVLPNSSTVMDERVVADCLNTLERLGSVGLAFIVLSLVLRCLAMCCHCGAGVFAIELHTMLKDGHYSEADPDMSSDESSSDESSGSS
mmetsp:Transcript_39052/g.112195  ORF Transcript_39052/g.112195 Transcript_39052/m.112195 type:complete len:238 (-) Transcript_39052:116-829(-)